MVACMIVAYLADRHSSCRTSLLQVYKYFRPLVQRSKVKTMVFFASNFGSLTLASEPLRHPEKSSPLDATQIAYKASKAAVNMGEL